ncbi:MAG: YbaN family protein [Methyloprofundus sp.]|nr:YbaN family protein [Methyloprofundus sp.]MDT8426454.1 YbaN family protein [Methyloprofundus sp.]
MRKRIKKYLLFVSGLLFLILGIIGAVLPILPTTPFLILALACFANSSPRCHLMLLNNRWFGGALQQWKESRSISRSSKIKAILMIMLTFSASIGVLHGKLPLQLMLLTLGSVLLIFMWRLKESEVRPVRAKE